MTQRQRRREAALRPDSQSPAARTRQDHAHELAQDYVELIAELIERHGEARLVDLARRLGVTHVTVNRAIQRLQRTGLVSTEPYRAIFLTPAGQRLARESRERHELVVRVLVKLGVAPAIAEADAEGIEHHVSRETLRAFRKYIESAPDGEEGRTAPAELPRPRGRSG